MGRRKKVDPKSGQPDVDVKTRLEAVALEMFAHRGYAGTSVADIVEAAGVTKPMMYYYFGDKEALHAHILNGARTALAEPTQPYASMSMDAIETLLGLAESLAEFYLASPEATTIAYQLAVTGDEFKDAPDLKEDFKTHRERLKTVINSGIKTGQLQGDANALATSILSVVYMDVLLRLNGPESSRPRSIIKASVSKLLDQFKA